jgi:(2Fe-2S) ferredoxin
LEKKLGVKEGHVREDGEYSIEFMECLADCGEGPIVMVDEDTFENIDEKKAEQLAELMIKGKLENSADFVSYEKSLLSETPSKAKKPSAKAKK